MKLHFYGADRCVTGSCHCLEINGKRILVDCGLQQGRDELDNAMFAFNPGDIDILLVTHAHIDHTGRIPLLVKRGFTGRILTTRVPTSCASCCSTPLIFKRATPSTATARVSARGASRSSRSIPPRTR